MQGLPEATCQPLPQARSRPTLDRPSALPSTSSPAPPPAPLSLILKDGGIQPCVTSAYLAGGLDCQRDCQRLSGHCVYCDGRQSPLSLPAASPTSRTPSAPPHPAALHAAHAQPGSLHPGPPQPAPHLCPPQTLPSHMALLTASQNVRPTVLQRMCHAHSHPWAWHPLVPSTRVYLDSMQLAGQHHGPPPSL